MLTVGMIGLGAMGEHMARNLAKAGFLSALYNRTTQKAEKLGQELNVTVAHAPQALAANVDIICLCVSRDEDVMEIIHAIKDTIRPNSVVIDMSTVSNHTAKKAAAILACGDVDFLDAPVSGGVEGAKSGKLAMMVGGDSAILEKVRPILASMAAHIVHIGPTGSGQATKAVNQIMAAGINQAVTEALTFAKAQQLPMDQIIDVISGGAASSWFLQNRGLSMTENHYPAGFKVALHQKDLDICLQMGRDSEVSLPITSQTRDDYAQLISQGLGECDISALYSLKTNLKTN
ncbi:MAG: NAD(P)-dependent oxidoreductase [Methylococcales bacterium]